MWDGESFSGTKIALIYDDQTVAYLRDDKPGIPFPGMWDLPGGGREGAETPIECGLREVEEEFGLRLNAADVLFVERHQSPQTALVHFFCAIRIDEIDLAAINFGNEGQCWELMPISKFVDHENAVPHLQNRLRSIVHAGVV